MPKTEVKPPLVIMGVAGCGKSSIGALCAATLRLPLLEGDHFHSPASLAKMRSGAALTDDDRAAWLTTLAAALRGHPEGVVLTCSALKRAYRDQLRAAAASLRFVFLDLTPDQARARVSARPGHVFPASLVDSQFQTLQRPDAEPGVLTLDAMQSPQHLCEQVRDWLLAEKHHV
jgi:gluconokinase